MKIGKITILITLLIALAHGLCLADSIIRGGEWGDAAPKVAYNSTDHEYLVVWNEFKTIPPFFGPVMGRRLGGHGEKLGPPFKIFDSGVKPDIAYDPDNNRYCVVCESNFQTRLCFLNAKGKNTSAPLPYDASTFPGIFYNTLEHNFLLIFIHLEDTGSGTCDRSLRAMAIDSNGVAGSEHVIRNLPNDSCTAGTYFAAAFAPINSTLTPNGRYLVGVGSVESPLHMLNRNGERVQVKPGTGGTGYEISFDADAETAENLDIAFGYRQGNAQDPVFLVVWGERGSKYFDGQQWTGIYGGVVDADLDDYSGEVNNFTFPISLQWHHLAQRVYAETWNPQTGYNPATGRFVVIWRETPGPSPDPRDLAEHNHIRAETLYSLERSWPDGNVLLSKDIDATDPGLPALAASAPSALALWQDNRNSATSMSDIYGALINVNNKTSHNLSTLVRGWMAVSAGISYSLGIQADGSLWAWGWNAYGQLGLGDNSNRNVPTQVGIHRDWIAVTAGDYHSLGIRSDGSLWAWGWNAYGQLGLGDSSNRNVPTQVGIHRNWIAVTVGDNHSLGIRSNGSLWAWGRNSWGQLGLGDSNDSHAPTQVGSDNWMTVAPGFGHSLGIRSNGSLWAWGWNADGQLGLGDTNDNHALTQVGSDNWITVASGFGHSLGIRADGSLWAWGNNGWGQLGLENTDENHAPTQVGIHRDWIAVTAGNYHSFGIRSDGSLWAWGRNSWGQLGVGDTDESHAFTQVGSDNWITVASRFRHSLGIRADGSLWSWGENYDGELGLGDNRNRNIPTRVGKKFPWPMFLPAMVGHHQ